jgi:hypothetical protein
MGSLRQHNNNLDQCGYLFSRFLVVATVFISISFSGCVPATRAGHLEFFFSENIWGGSPFNEAQKKELFVEALKGRKSESATKPVPFEISDASVIVKRFDALYQVDAVLGLPEVRSGYVLELDLPANPPERVTFTNRLTGVSWSVNLRNISSQNVSLR